MSDREHAPSAFEVKSLDRLVADADALRDTGRFASAAEAYRAAVERAPERADLWVQLGNMLKDAGRYAESETAYRSAIERAPRSPDTYLQLGRALKLSGNRDGALEAFTSALGLAPASRDVINELVMLGQGWLAARQGGLGHALAVDIVEALDGLKRAVARIERDLPSLSALSAVPAGRYDVFRRIYRVPPPPAAAPEAAIGIIMLPGMELARATLALASVRGQTHNKVQVAFPSLAGEPLALLRALAAGTPGLLAEVAPPAAAESLRDRLAAAAAALSDAHWIAVMAEPSILDREAAAWIAAATHASDSVALFADGDEVQDAASQCALHGGPRLRGGFDPELLAQGFDFGPLLAVRRDVLKESLRQLCGEQVPDSRLWFRLAETVAAQGRIVHIPQVLVSRLVDETGEQPSQPVPDAERFRAAQAIVVPSPRPLLSVVIPSRNSMGLLQSCIAALKATAADAASLRILIVDNGSDDPETLRWLGEGRAKRAFSVIDAAGPFNWSRLSNMGAAASGDPLLLFLNNDVELITPGWDDILRALLSRPEVAIVGARLAYPDNTLQHAGIAVGFNGSTEHEGRGEPLDAPGPLGRWQTRRSASAVTGAFLACRRTGFDALGRFDERELGIWFSDADLCLKARAAGGRVIYEPRILAIHKEAKSIAPAFEPPLRSAVYEAAAAVMRSRWGEDLGGDPYVNPHYARFGRPFAYLKA